MHGEPFLHTHTIDDTLSSLELASEFFDRAQLDGRYWKWFVLALHAGVQGTFALVLERGNGLVVQKPGVTARTIEAIDAGNVPPEPHMDNFQRLYRKVSELMQHDQARSQLDASTEAGAVKGLDELRDNFAHFNVKSWSIEQALIERHSRNSLKLVRDLLRDRSLVRLYEESDDARASSALAQLSARLKIDA